MAELHGDAASARLDVLYARQAAADVLVIKAAGIGEVAQMARLELRLRKYLAAKWEVRRAEAVRAAYKAVVAGKKAPAVTKVVDRVMGRWAGDVSETFKAEIGQFYKLGRLAGHKKATKRTKASLSYNLPEMKPAEDVKKAKPPRGRFRATPRFDLRDRRASAALGERQVLWIGDHYSDHVAQTIAETTRDTMVEHGTGSVEAGRTLADRVRDELGIVSYPGSATSADMYFEGVAANAATVARAYGQIRSFAQVGITKYTIVNPDDERTCPVCSLVNGKVFTTQQAVAQIGREAAAESPDDIRDIHPWLSPVQFKGVSGSSEALAAAGQALPPYHFKCRCAVDIDESIGSFDDLEPTDLQ